MPITCLWHCNLPFHIFWQKRGVPLGDPSVEKGVRSLNSSSSSGGTVIHVEKKAVSEVVQLVVDQFTLNEEQEIAFRKIVSCSFSNRSEPLRLFLGGPGGTGKSRVIDALKEFFVLNGDSRRFRLASYTGVAARNISRMTLHSALSLETIKKKKGSRNKSKSELIDMWSGVDFLFIDEVSMVSCELLLEISEALMVAKENDTPFGGVNIVFAGDFCQLPPVGGTRLYASASDSPALTNEKQNSNLGRLLWLGVKDCVFLTQQMRQSGEHNKEFRDLLDRMRSGRTSGFRHQTAGI